jgi:hypothetical protein
LNTTIQCDGCGERSAYRWTTSMKRLVEFLREDGWILDADLNLCPTCARPRQAQAQTPLVLDRLDLGGRGGTNGGDGQDGQVWGNGTPGRGGKGSNK